MIIRKPAYYDAFHCIASTCPDSCCKEWDVDVDPSATELYTTLASPLGDRLRQVLQRNEDGSSCMEIIAGRCPMWQEDGLCRIQAELGHDALCKTCREFPRLTHDYGNFQEWNLELSCPEAARIILTSPDLPIVTQELPGGEAPEYDVDAMDVLLKTRETVLTFLKNPKCSIPEALAVLLLYGYQAQGELDGDTFTPLDPAQSLRQAYAFATTGNKTEIIRFFHGLEILTPIWHSRLESPLHPGQWRREYLKLAQYFVERYWLQAVSDYDLVSRVKFSVISCLMVYHLGGNIIETAQAYSKEIENSAENMDALLDAAYTHPAFTDTNLLGLLLN